MTFLKSSGLALSLALSISSSAAFAADGGTLFKQRCTVCHATKAGVKSGSGPNLSGVAGRQAGTGAYPYSAALKKSKLRWDARNLDAWLSGPSKMVPGTRMFTAVPNAEDRKQIVAYLSTLKGQ